MKAEKLLLNSFDPDKITNSYRLEDFMTAHLKSSTDAVIESDEGVSEWEKHFTQVDMPWVTLTIPIEATGKIFQVIWKVVDKTRLKTLPMHFKPLSK